MKYRVVQCVEGKLIADEPTDILAWAEVRGIQIIGEHRSSATRAELQGQPRFKSLAGPMWDGDAIRYEDIDAYKTLSA